MRVFLTIGTDRFSSVGLGFYVLYRKRPFWVGLVDQPFQSAQKLLSSNIFASIEFQVLRHFPSNFAISVLVGLRENRLLKQQRWQFINKPNKETIF